MTGDKENPESDFFLKVPGILLNIEFVFVQGGCFEMGDERFYDAPPHFVCVDSFYMSKYEITQNQYKQVMGDNPAFFNDDFNKPVENVRWLDANNFANRLSELSGKQLRLPTEAEWEFAARGGGKEYDREMEKTIRATSWSIENSSKSTHSVGALPPNQLGLHDMTGNVMEYCFDWYRPKYYVAGPLDNPLGPVKGRGKVLRGRVELSV